ncbi:MAG TPA: hypothetical protein VF611_02055 [Pyrinomonadaceae bacterium]|jgi:aspartokinase
MSTTWVVRKFGGTRPADAGRCRPVGRILPAGRSAGTRAAVVVSDLPGPATFPGDAR